MRVRVLMRAALGIAFLQTFTVQAQTPPSPAMVHARILAAQGDAQGAAQTLTEALKSDSLNVDLLLALADVQRTLRQKKERRATLERVLKIQVRSAAARVEIARDFFEQNRMDSAAVFANSAMLLSNRRSGGAFYWLGRIHEQAGRLDSAYYYYDRAYTVLPSRELF